MILWLGIGVGLGALLGSLFLAAGIRDEDDGTREFGSFLLAAAFVCLGLLIVWNDGDREVCREGVDSGIYHAQLVGKQGDMVRVLITDDEPGSGNDEHKCRLVPLRAFSEKPDFSVEHKLIHVTKDSGFTRVKVLQGE